MSDTKPCAICGGVGVMRYGEPNPCRGEPPDREPWGPCPVCRHAESVRWCRERELLEAGRARGRAGA